MRLVPLFCLSLLALTSIACGKDDKSSAPIDDLGDSGSAGSSGAAGSKADASADAPADSSADSTVDASADSALADSTNDIQSDTATDATKDVVIEYNIQPCSVGSRAVGSKTLLASMDTPDAFKAAYNAEVASMAYPGPMLMVFNGLDSLDSSKWKLQIGPLTLADSSSKVAFANSPAEIPFSLGEGFTINLPQTSAPFTMRFATATTTADLPIASVLVSGNFDSVCSSLQLETIYMFVPETASSLPFHGSTVGALMGAPDQSINGGKDNAWVLALSGSSEPVEVQ